MTLTVCRAGAQKLPGRVAPDQEDQSQPLYQDRQNPYSRELFGETHPIGIPTDCSHGHTPHNPIQKRKPEAPEPAAEDGSPKEAADGAETGARLRHCAA